MSSSASQERKDEGASICVAIATLARSTRKKWPNEDFVLTWVPNSEGSENVAWAVAMADGVSSSYFAREAAELVCWTALEHLVNSSSVSSLTVAEEAVSHATETLYQLGELVRADPQGCMPLDDYASTWAYVLRKGRFLQTTLTLAWECEDILFLAIVGDGGALLSSGKHETVDWITSKSKDSHVVHALGPDKLSGQQLDLACSIEVSRAYELALFTDGLHPAISGSPGYCFERPTLRHAANSARAIIGEWLQTDPSQFDDNLTLALVVRDDRSDNQPG